MKASALAAVLACVLAAPAFARPHLAWPPHHALWSCIQPNESNSWHDRRNPGHRGGLQLHSGWGYGTSYDAADDSRMVQERAAELAYRANGYSHSWVVSQWLVYDHAYYCLKYA